MARQITTLSTTEAPTPAGPYSQIVRAGDLVFLAGQTARTPEGRIADVTDRAAQCRRALTNLGTLAATAGGSLADAVKVTVYLADLAWKQDFDAVYTELVGTTPARTTVRATPPTGGVEVDAILYLPEVG